MSTALAERRQNVAVANRPLLMADTLQIEAEQRRLLGEYVKQQMIPDTDYGVIPGTQQKSLKKPGAEKLCSLFHCTPRFTIQEKIEDWENGFFYYQFHVDVEANESGAIVAEGFGSANSRESKWRYRNADRLCPQCQQPAIKKSKFPPRNDPNAAPGFYCYAKIGGCGIEFAADDPEIVDQAVGKKENPDPADNVNTILKMAKKRALVDAAIALARCSDLFTMDIDEDQPSEPDAKTAAPAKQQRQEQPAERQDPRPAQPMLVTELRSLIGQLADLKQISADEAFSKIEKYTGETFKPIIGKPTKDWPHEALTYAINSARKTILKLEAELAAANERQPGDDDEGDPNASPPPEHKTANVGAKTLPKPVVDLVLVAIAEAESDWGQVRTQSQGIIGRHLDRNATPSGLSLDEADKVMEWCKRAKAALVTK